MSIGNCYVLNYVSRNLYRKVPNHNVTVFEDRDFNKVIKIKLDHKEWDYKDLSTSEERKRHLRSLTQHMWT